MGVAVDGEERVETFGITSVSNPLPVDEDTLFQIGSITKTFTATILVILAERGVLSLDDPVRRYVPELELADETVRDGVTIRHLLQHTSGFAGDYFVDTGAGSDALDLYVAGMASLPQLIPPDTFAVYNNAGFSLAGLVIERVTGRAYHDVCRDLMIVPLGLTNTLLQPTRVMTRRFAVGHQTATDGTVVVTDRWDLPRAAWPGGGIASSVRDQLRYARFVLGDGSPLLSSNAKTGMLDPGPKYTPGIRFGLSWQISEPGGHRLVAHSGGTNGQSSLFWVFPDADIAFTSLTNSNSGQTINTELGTSVLELFLGYVPDTPQPVEVTDFEEYEGRYRVLPHNAVLEVTAHEGSLWIVEVESGDLGGLIDERQAPAASKINFNGADVFSLQDGDMHGAEGEFIRRESGEIAYLHMSRLLIKET